MAELLRMEGITKQFGAVYANKDINLSIEEGEIFWVKMVQEKVP